MSDQVKKIVSKLTADKKKFSLMVGLIAVALLMWGRLLLKEVPRSATASPEQQVAGELLSGNSEAGGMSSYQRNVVYVEIPQSTNRDLFYLKRSIYVEDEKETGNGVSPGKSSAIPSDEQERIKAAATAFSGLRLETTIMGETPKALINGKLVGVGKNIAGFKVKQILSHSVVLERQGRDYRLDMH